jgi:hypothetical protein
MSLAPFLASIAKLDGPAARTAKLNYVRNAVISYSVYLEDVRTFSFLQISFAVVPVFWPLLYVQRKSIMKGARRQRDQISHALDLWSAELSKDGLALRTELDALAANEPRFLPWSKKQPPQLPAGKA